MRKVFFVLFGILCFNILLPINIGDNPKSLIPVPSPTYQKIHIRGYSVDTLNGKIYIAGKFSSFDGQNKRNLVRLNLADGSVDNTWNPKCSGDVMDILYDNGKIFIIGNLDTINGVPDRYAACIDANGNFVWTRGNNDPAFWNNSIDNKFIIDGKPFLLLSANDIVAVNLSISDSFLTTPTSTSYAITTQQFKATAFNINTGSLVQTNAFANAYNLLWDNLSSSATKIYTASNYTKINNKDYFTLKYNDYVIASFDGLSTMNSPMFTPSSSVIYTPLTDVIYIDTIAGKLRTFHKTNYEFINASGFGDTSSVCLFDMNTLAPLALNSISEPENYYYKRQGFVPIYIDPITSGPSSYSNNNIITYSITKDKRNNQAYFGINRQGFKGINTYVTYINNVVEPALGTTLNMPLQSQYQDTLSQITDITNYNIKSMEPRNLRVFQNKLINISSAHPAINDTIDYINTYCLFTDIPKITNVSLASVSVGQTPTITVCANQSKKIAFQRLSYVVARNHYFTGTNVSFSYTHFDTLLINASASATSGYLKFTSMSDCGRGSDTLKVFLVILPQPNAVASSPIPTISCFYRKAPIKASSITSNVSYSWVGPSGYTSFNQNDSTAYQIPGKYITTVTNTITGCSKKDSVNISIDTLRPIVVLPSSAVNIYCSPDSSLLSGSSPSPNPNVWWHKANSGVKYNNPYYTKSIGNYYMVVQNMTNGCKDSSTFVVGDKRVLPNSKITSHTFVPAPIPIASITCSNTVITIAGASDTLNTILTWKNIATNTIFSNPLSTSVQGNFTFRVKRTDNGCADSSKTIFINQNITPPNISVLTPTASINCSSATATLNANTLTSGATLSWSGPASFTSANPAITSQQGKYYVVATDASNGCIRKDSAIVNYTPSLSVKASNDTMVCKNAPVSLSAVSIGTLSGISYVWSNGVVAQTISVNPTVTANYIVTASAPNGCTGKDTLRISVPTDIQDSVVTTKNCNGTSAGSIAVYIKGGIAPYQISFNAGVFSSQTTFTNLPYGTYSIQIKDSLGCSKYTSATINQNSSLPTPVFIASTQNTKGDTIVLIDLTVPKADSVQWTLPLNATLVGGDMFNPLVFFADTGNYVITLTAFYADCSFSTTKNIHVAPVDTAMASATNNNGIKSITLYPNPNSGQFTADVEFYKKQNASIMIIDANSVKQYQQNFLNTIFVSLPVDVSNLSNGTYIFKVIGEYNSKHINFVISK